MHVALNGWFWDQPNTGSGQYLRHLLHALRRVAPDLRRVAPDLHHVAPDLHLTLVLPPHIQTADNLPQNVNVVTTQGRSGNLGKIWFEQRTYPLMVGRVGADIAHVPYWGPPLSSPARLVTSVLDVIPLTIPAYSGGFLPKLYTSLVTTGARGSAHLLTISQAAKNEIMQELAVADDFVTVTPLAADESYHPRMGSERDEAVRQKYGLPQDFVLYLGGYDVRKQVNQLLLAWTYVAQAEGDNVTLVLAGREPKWGSPMFPDMRQYAADLKMTDYVQWAGYVDEADKPALYRLAKVFVFPTISEGFGLPVLEAMASGTPVVANNISSIPEIVGDGAYLVDPGDSRKMAGAIIALLLQNPLRETLIAQGLAQATRFSWRKTARATLDVYERVMAM